MAIQFARVELVGRACGGNACRKGAYNARDIISDNRSNITFNFKEKGDNVYHKIFLPKHVDKKFENTSELMNEVEKSEVRKNSSLLKDIVIALPDDKELDLQDRINISHNIIEKMEWIKEGLGVQLDIHKPHDGEKNWHAHILVTKRRFAECGTKLGAKARDLDIQIRGGKNPIGIKEEEMIHEKVRDVINDYFKELGLENKVDIIGMMAQEHIGPVRMRHVLNKAIERNEERRVANIETINSGEKLIDYITKSASTFTKSDLFRATKIIHDINRRNSLVDDALIHKSIIELYDENGKHLNLFTTKYVREEEEKLLRMSKYVVNIGNQIHSKKFKMYETKKIENKINSLENSKELSLEQCKALSHLIFDKSGLRIMRGRAGVGKSRLLAHLVDIYKDQGVNVIGLAPTHKARDVFEKFGCSGVDTVKGMLFKLNYNRFSLPKHSVIIVDEAGMIGNDDYLELLRVAATRKCNVILSGDEKQISSISRGGMFEMFSSKYGSCSVLNIQRQENAFGREVAMSLSCGNVSKAISILDANNAIIRSDDVNKSMETLLKDWDSSNYSIDNKLIISVKREDVTALNHGAREYLKMQGKLIGAEVDVNGNYYMMGDRIIIKKTDKNLGVVNGDVAIVLKASIDKFSIKLLDKDVNISFNPSEFSEFSHAYATTIFKAQGSSVRDVYFYHNKFAGLKNSYVALSRNINEVKLYINSASTFDNNHLIKQLSIDPDRSVSINYLTKQEYEYLKTDRNFEKNKTLFGSILVGSLDYIGNKLEVLTDKYIPKSEYYNYKDPKISTVNVQNVLEDIVTEKGIFVEESKKVIGGNDVISTTYLNNNNVINKSDHIDVSNNSAHTNKIQLTNIKTSKEVFYNRVERSKYLKENQESYNEIKQEYKEKVNRLRYESSFKAEYIAKNLLGNPNSKLSNNRELRFGNHGKLVVAISGNKAGLWHDFSENKGGDIFDLVTHARGSDFKSTIDYLENIIRTDNTALLVHENDIEARYLNYTKSKEIQENYKIRQQAKIDKLYARSKILSNNSVAYKYLSTVRGISAELSDDIRTTGIYIKEKEKYLPALISFARDCDGNITGYQQIIIDPKTNNKADIDAPKKSVGKITGSFVKLGNCHNRINKELSEINNINKKNQVTIIAEGVETGLSIKQALSSDKNMDNSNCNILCSLGISNIKNYQVKENEKIIIASDNDGYNASTNEIIKNSKFELESKGAFVEIVTPEVKGDFNDILQGRILEENHSDREERIISQFTPAIELQRANNVEEFLNAQEKYRNIPNPLNIEDKKNLANIEKYEILESNIVDLYRKGYVLGKEKLIETAKFLEKSISFYKENESIFKIAVEYGYDKSKQEIIKQLVGLNNDSINEFYKKIETNNIKQASDVFDKKRQEANSYNDMLKEMDNKISFFSNLKLKHSGHNRIEEICKVAHSYRQERLIDKLENVCKFAIASSVRSEKDLMKELGDAKNFKDVYVKIDKDVEIYNVKSNLEKISLQKCKAETLSELVDIFKFQQETFLNLSKTIKYQNDHNEDIRNLFKNTHENKNLVEELRDLSKFMEERKYNRDGSMTKILRTINDPKIAYDNLLTKYHEGYISIIHQGLKTIEDGKIYVVNNKKFNCAVEFMDYIKNNHVHKYTPDKELEKTYNQFVDNQRQLEKTKEIDMDIPI